jgi:hypothetical protein
LRSEEFCLLGLTWSLAGLDCGRIRAFPDILRFPNDPSQAATTKKQQGMVFL